MLVAKQVADLITYTRTLLAFGFVWLGITQGDTSLTVAVWLLLIAWTSDALDGTLARRSRRQYQTWIGDHDLEVDMFVAFGLALYLVTAGWIDLWILSAFSLTGVLIFWHWGFHRALGMVIQAPVYGAFIWVALHQAPGSGVWLCIWVLAAIAVTWPRFPKAVIPGFLTGIKEVVNLRRTQ